MSAKRKPSIANGASALVNSAEDYYEANFDQFANLLADSPPGDALTVQLLHYLSDPNFASRDVLGWALSGAMVSLLAHLTGGAHEKKLHRTRNQGMAKWMPILIQLLEPWDTLILAHTATTGFGLTASEPVFWRVEFWSKHDGRKFEAWTAAANKAARIQRQAGARPPLDDPLFPKFARIIIAELKVQLTRLRNQSRTNLKATELVQFFQQQAESHEFEFLNDPHNLQLWLKFVSLNPAVFWTQSKRPGAIFDLFQQSVSGHEPDYIRQKRSRG